MLCAMNRIAWLGLACCGVALLQAFVLFKANRLLAGTAISVLQVPWLLQIVLPLLLFIVAGLFVKARAVLLWLLGTGLMIALFILLSIISKDLGVNLIARVSPAAGFWLLLIGATLIAYAGALELQKLWLVLIGVVVGVAMLLFGFFDAISVMREYYANQNEFWQEVLRHCQLTLWAFLLSSCLGIALGIFAASRPMVSRWSLGVANAFQTIPSIALFALLIPFFSAIARTFPLLETIGIRGIGIAPALTTLTLYGLLPVLRGTILGLQSVAEAPLEAARGLGFNPWQIFVQIRLPLSIPIVLEGLRLTSVSLIGLVSLSSLIGAGGLGGFIFTGLGSGAIDRVLLGAIPILILALLVNSLMRGLELRLTPHGIR